MLRNGNFFWQLDRKPRNVRYSFLQPYFIDKQEAYRHLIWTEQRRELNGGQKTGTYAVLGGEPAFANGRINYFFKLSGPSFNIDTACSSRSAAVQAACSALWAGEGRHCPSRRAGQTRQLLYMLSKGHLLSKTCHCTVWDKDAGWLLLR